jgi:hypothetical protein
MSDRVRANHLNEEFSQVRYFFGVRLYQCQRCLDLILDDDDGYPLECPRCDEVTPGSVVNPPAPNIPVRNVQRDERDVVHTTQFICPDCGYFDCVCPDPKLPPGY